jgi:hypothetical protein
MPEPDWKSLADWQFVLYNRIADSLNAALSSIALSDMPEAQDRPPGFWKDRATAKIANVLNMFTAWSYLIRYKMGEPIPDRSIRPFRVNTLLAWLGTQLQLSPTPATAANPLLHANQETLQEALLLLYSAAFTQGTGVQLTLDVTRLGTWFRIRFFRSTPLPGSLDDLLASFGDHWRAQSTVFELTTARDFIRLNGGELILKPLDNQGEFSFFVRAAGARRPQLPLPLDAESNPPPPDSITPPPARPEGTATEVKELDATPVIPPPAPEEPAEPPALATLRPLPPPSQLVPLLTALKAQAASEAEGQSPPVEPEEPPSRTAETAPGANEHPSAAAADASGLPSKTSSPLAARDESARPPAPSGESSEPPAVEPAAPPVSANGSEGQASPSDPVIIPVKLPAPTLPDRLRTPPASTSNVALTRDPQTFAPSESDSSPKPAKTAPPDEQPADPAPASDSHTSKESP